MKKCQMGGKTPSNRLEKKGMTQMDMTGKKVPTSPKPKPLAPGKASKASKLDILVGKSEFQKLMRGGSKSSC